MQKSSVFIYNWVLIRCHVELKKSQCLSNFCCTMAEEDLFNKTNFNLALFLKMIDALLVS